jgi:hypothetical protein
VSKAPLVRIVTRDRSGPGLRLRLHRVAFGVPIVEDAVPNRDGTSDRIYHFAPGSVFAMVWSRRTCLGRMRRVLAVVEAPRLSGGERRPLPGVRPGVIVHATLTEFGPAGSVAASGDVDRMLELIDRVRAAGLEPARVPARYWAAAAGRIMFGRPLPGLPRLGPTDRRRRA